MYIYSSRYILSMCVYSSRYILYMCVYIYMYAYDCIELLSCLLMSDPLISHGLQDTSLPSLVTHIVKDQPANEDVQSLGQEVALEKGMATHSSIPAWSIPMDRGAWWATVHGVTKSQTRLS